MGRHVDQRANPITRPATVTRWGGRFWRRIAERAADKRERNEQGEEPSAAPNGLEHAGGHDKRAPPTRSTSNSRNYRTMRNWAPTLGTIRGLSAGSFAGGSSGFVGLEPRRMYSFVGG